MGTPVIPIWILERIARQYWHWYGTLSVKALRRAVNGYASTERIARVVRWVKASPGGGTVQVDADPRRVPPGLLPQQRGRRSSSPARRRTGAGPRAPIHDAVAARLRLLQGRPRTRRGRRSVRDNQLPIRQRDKHCAPASQPPQTPFTDERAIAAAVVPTPPPAKAATAVATNGIDARVPNLPTIDTVASSQQQQQRWPVEATPLATVLGLVATEFVRRVHVRALRFLSSVLRVVRPNA